ncbi:MAG: bifunctional metallophosphatase/5'-nucleotidase [Flavobacterium sp.]|nr:bifunctional metallophosphatase/5'-nucleotidase [Flavobacterium sp.]
MKRREFIEKTAASAALVGIGLGTSAFTESHLKKLTILHTNDVHSYIEPFAANHPKYPNMGGVARRAALIGQIRKTNPNVLLVDSGDIFQGTPYFNYYKGALEFTLMSKMGYDFATLGNHDFDNGIEGFHEQLHLANFPFVSANYIFKNTLLDGLISPYKVVIKDGIKIGVFGLGIDFDGLVDKRNYKETVYLDPIEIANDTASQLKNNEKCDLVICLSHLGYSYKEDKISDVKLATQTKNIDLILGGHTHTFLEKPTVLKNIAHEEVIINQAGCYGVLLGQIDFSFDKNTKTNHRSKSIVV